MGVLPPEGGGGIECEDGGMGWACLEGVIPLGRCLGVLAPEPCARGVVYGVIIGV